MNSVSKDMMIGDVIKKFPDSAEIFQSYGLQCLGCHVNLVESIEMGSKTHGMEDKVIDEMVSKVNDSIQSNGESIKNDNPVVKFTDSAVNKIILLSNGEKESKILRVEVEPGGCSGLQYGMKFVKESKENDVVIEKEGVQIILDPESLQKLDGTEIDYIDTLNESGFKFQNPNASSTCGCGSSFR